MMRMLTEGYFAQSPVLIFPVIALCLFMTVFVVVTLRALSARKSDFDAMASMPLEDSSSEEGGHE